MTDLTIAAAAAPFSRDMDECLATVARLIDDAREQGVGLLVLPEAGARRLHRGPPLRATPSRRRRSIPTDPSCAGVIELAGDMVVCVGFFEEEGGGARHNVAACVTGDGAARLHRKVHHAPARGRAYDPRRPARRVRHPGRPDRACSSATTRPSPRRRGRSRSTAPRSSASCRPGRRARRTTAPRAAGRPPVAPIGALGPLARGGELPHRRLREPDRHVRHAALPRRRAGSSARPATSLAATGADAGLAVAELRRRGDASSALGGRSPPSATCAPTSTATAAPIGA